MTQGRLVIRRAVAVLRRLKRELAGLCFERVDLALEQTVNFQNIRLLIKDHASACKKCDDIHYSYVQVEGRTEGRGLN